MADQPKPVDPEELKRLVSKLWEAANSHCVMMYGEFIILDHKGPENPPPLDDPLESIEEITKYLESSQ